MTTDALIADLRRLLDHIACHDPSREEHAPEGTLPEQEYAHRNTAIMGAMALAMKIGIPAGFQFDPAEPDWPAAFIDLPTGQVSWHLPAFPMTYDGHTTAEKYERIRQYGAILDQAR